MLSSETLKFQSYVGVPYIYSTYYGYIPILSSKHM
jgi:hypothetical protein